MQRSLLLLLSTLWASVAMAQGSWVADLGDGTYKNPVLYADYSDPDLVRVGDDYWMTASSFNCAPGLPILHSTDLVNWRLVGHALPIQEPRSHFDRPAHGDGVWAPATMRGGSTSIGAIPTTESTWSRAKIQAESGQNPTW